MAQDLNDPMNKWPDGPIKMIPSIRIALMSIKLVMRTKVALFFTFLFPLLFLFVYAGIFAQPAPLPSCPHWTGINGVQ